MAKALSSFSKGSRLSGVRATTVGARLMWHSLKYPIHRHLGFPKVLPKYARLSITDMCDSKCSMCHIWTIHKTDPKTGKFKQTKKLKSEMTLNEFKQFVDSNPFLEDIMLTGGQTTLKKDIIEYWLYLDKKGYRTGGPINMVKVDDIIKIQEELLSKLSGKQSHCVSVSIDGLGKVHDEIRGTPGGFKSAIKFLKWAKKQQAKYPFFDVVISHNITPNNYKEFPKFIDFFINEIGIKASGITFRPTQLGTRFSLKTSTTHQIISDKSANVKQDMLKVLKSIINKYPVYDDFYFRGLKKFFNEPNKQVMPCSAGFNTFFGDPYWNIYPCAPEMNNIYKIGNLRETGFKIKPLWQSNRIKQIQKNIKEGKCTNCWTRCHSSQSVMANPIRLARVYKDNLWRLIPRS